MLDHAQLVQRLTAARIPYYNGQPTGENGKCYLSGPMTGLPYFNFPAFEAGAQILRQAGWFVYNPRENDDEAGVEPDPEGKKLPEGVLYKDLMKRDLWQVCDSDVVFVLPGWEYSEGCLLEVEVAHRVGVKVLTYLSQREVEPEERSPHEFSTRQLGAQDVVSIPPAYGRDFLQGDPPPPAMLNFETGATRNRKEDELAYEGFLSPLALKMYAEYMHRHRHTADGGVREPDNWQNGIPFDSYMDSLWRHVMDLWLIHRGWTTVAREGLESALSGLFFNVQGYMHETAKQQIEKEAA